MPHVIELFKLLMCCNCRHWPCCVATCINLIQKGDQPSIMSHGDSALGGWREVLQ